MKRRSIDLAAALAALVAQEENHLFDFTFAHPSQCTFFIGGVAQSCSQIRLWGNRTTKQAAWFATDKDGNWGQWTPIHWRNLAGSPGSHVTHLRWTNEPEGTTYCISTALGAYPDFERFREVATEFDPPF